MIPPRHAGNVARAAAVALLVVISLIAIRGASLVVDGTRYFWLDDDQLISMRYARNLADGQGLVWNAGERVEGYSNFLWTLLMAGIHAAGVGDAKAALVVMLLNTMLAGALLVASDRLLEALVPQPGFARPVLLVSLALCVDVLFWSVNGFETILFALCFVGALARLLAPEPAARWPAYAAMALLPLIRADGLPAWGAAAMFALAVSRDRRRTSAALAVSLLPALAHLVWRHAYYGAWLPNTYYLKVHDVPDRLDAGLRYLVRIGRRYGVALALAAWAVAAARRRVETVLAATVVIALVYAVVVGGDTFPHARFFAHAVPVVFILALAAARRLAHVRPRLAVAAVAALIVATVLPPLRFLPALNSTNGGPAQGLVTGLLIARNTAPDCRVAVIAAGAAPYFDRRPAVDLLGKCDPRLARAPGRRGFQIGHDKLDPEASLAVRPDLVVHILPAATVRRLAADPETARQTGNYNAVVASSPMFVRDYLPFPVEIPAMPSFEAHGSVFARRDSAEAARRTNWTVPAIAR